MLNETQPISFGLAILWTIFIYWLGYGDGKLKMQEKYAFERLDKILKKK